MCRLTRAQLETLRAEWGTKFRHTVELRRRSETSCTTFTEAEPVAERSGGATTNRTPGGEGVPCHEEGWAHRYGRAELVELCQPAASEVA